jgi:predicted nuclease with TOPRIM domain
MLNEKQLLDLKEDVGEAKQKVAELTGQNTALINQLKTDYSCKTIAEAEEKLAKMDKDISIIDKKIEDGIKDLETKYEV